MSKNFNMISIDGIDKSGKGILFQYLKHMNNYQYALLDRGPISNYMFAKLYNREFNFDLSSFSNVLFIVLSVKYEDWLIRCKMSNEPKIDYDLHCRLYKNAIKDFESSGCTVLQYNTTQKTPFNIAKDVINFLSL